jgi:hypothetical protein
VTVAGHGLTAVGVVLGQGQGGDTSVILAAAGEAAQQLVDSVAPAAGGPSRLLGLVPPTRTATRSYSLPVPRARTDVTANDHPQENA